MPFNREIGAGTNAGKLRVGQTDIDLDNAMAVCASEVVMVMLLATDAIVVCAVCELDAIEQAERD